MTKSSNVKHQKRWLQQRYLQRRRSPDILLVINPIPIYKNHIPVLFQIMLFRSIFIASSLATASGREVKTRDLAGKDGHAKRNFYVSKQTSGGTTNYVVVTTTGDKRPNAAQIAAADGNWKNDGFAAIDTPRPTPRPNKWGGDGFQPLVTPNPTPLPTWKGDAFVDTPKPTKWSGDGHCMIYHPNSYYDTCTNSDMGPTEYSYESLEACCMAIFGTTTCNYEDVCIPNITPAPTPCTDMKFFYYDEKCTNDIIIPGADFYGMFVIRCLMHTFERLGLILLCPPYSHSHGMLQHQLWSRVLCKWRLQVGGCLWHSPPNHS